MEKLSPINGKKDGLNPISSILSTQKAIVTSTLDTIKPLLMEELDAKQTPKISTKFSTTLQEQNPSGIPLTYLQPLPDILPCFQSEAGVPQDMKNAKIVTLYKNKGDRSELQRRLLLSIFNNWHNASTVGPIFAKYALKWR